MRLDDAVSIRRHSLASFLRTLLLYRQNERSILGSRTMFRVRLEGSRGGRVFRLCLGRCCVEWVRGTRCIDGPEREDFDRACEDSSGNLQLGFH